MTRLLQSIEIAANPREVFGYLWDANNLMAYFPVSRVQVLEQAADRVKLRHDFTASGRTMDLVCLQEVAEPARKIRFRTLEGMALDGTWLVQELTQGIKLTCVVTYTPPGGIIGKVMDALMMKKEMTRIYAEGLSKIKQAIEK